MELSLTIDQGNSSAKVSVFDGDTLLRSCRIERLTAERLDKTIESLIVTRAIYSSVVGNDDSIRAMLDERRIRSYTLDAQLPMPLTIDYSTPGTLGHDRIAAAVGAMAIAPATDCLVIDAGTAVTYDFVDASGTFRGGNIAPGLSLRFEALSAHCAQLPHTDTDGDIPTIGYDTPTAIRSGVVLGIIGETDYLWHRLGKPLIVLTGGDSEVLAPRLKEYNIVTDNDLVAKGLNRILKYNESL